MLAIFSDKGLAITLLAGKTNSVYVCFVSRCLGYPALVGEPARQESLASVPPLQKHRPGEPAGRGTSALSPLWGNAQQCRPRCARRTAGQ